MANQFLGLSLFIMLLSFFIILNTVSEFDNKKAQPILNSLSLAFAKEIDEESVLAASSRRTGDSEGKGSALDKIQGLFTAQIAGVEAKQNRLGTMLRLRMPFSIFEKEVMSSLKAPSGKAGIVKKTREFFVPTLVSLLDLQEKTPYKMDLIVHAGGIDSTLRDKRVRQIAKIANKIEQAGLPRKLVSVGIGPEKTTMVDIYFRRYAPFNPFVSERGEDE